jgi:hypothetical protein
MRAVLLFAGLLAAASAGAAYQVRFIQVKVPPYYEAGPQRADRPRVNVHSGFDRELSSTAPADIAAVRDAIRADPGQVTPITMMVLAIRLYDAGLRDDAVFWFHAARDRMATAAAALDPKDAEIARMEAATRAFALRIGPIMNGYALCDVGRHVRLRREALDWVEKNPFEKVFVETVRARPGDRRQHVAGAVRALRAEAEEDAHALANPEGAAKLAAARRASEAEAKYCWK